MLEDAAATAHLLLPTMNAVGFAQQTMFETVLLFIVSCCPSLTLSSTDSAFLDSGYDFYIGSFKTYTTTPMLNDRAVYQLESSPAYCMWYAGLTWYINKCDAIGSELGYDGF